MDAIIKIKQIPDSFAISTGLDKYNRSRMPFCRDILQVAEGYDRRAITGMDEDSQEFFAIQDLELREKKREEAKALRLNLEKLTGEDLSAKSKFWDTFFIEISSDNELVLNKSNPIQVIMYHALVANGYAAPNIESIGMPKYRNAKYYCFTEERFEEEKVSTEKLRDKARGSLLSMADNEDKMLIIGQYLEGFSYKKGMKPDTLYSKLSVFINTNKENVVKFNEAVATPVVDLQYKITIDRAIKSKKIKFKDGQFYRGGVNLGKNIKEVMETLKSPEYTNEFISIHEEV